jgi:hypothetical protein
MQQTEIYMCAKDLAALDIYRHRTGSQLQHEWGRLRKFFAKQRNHYVSLEEIAVYKDINPSLLRPKTPTGSK